MTPLSRRGLVILVLGHIALTAWIGPRVLASDVQGASRPSGEVTPGTGVIRGRVTAADTRAPLRRARVVLSAPSLAVTRVAETDMDGRYEFTDLPAGRYGVKGGKGQFVPLEFGQRRAFESGTAIELRDAQTLDHIDLALPRGAVIAGRIVDDLGEPVAWARVSAMRVRYEEGRRALVPVGRAAVTNDLGQYRLYGLPPGRYAVGTIPEQDSQGEFGFAPAYYPGTQDPAGAQAVTVGLAEEKLGVDFLQPPGRLVRVSGTVSDSRGRSLAGAAAGLIDIGTGRVTSTPVEPDGSFAFERVAPGEYGLSAGLRDPATGAMNLVMLPVTVAGADLAGLVIRIVPGASISGHVVTDSGGPPPFSPAGVRMSVTPLRSSIPMSLPSGGAVTEDWSFEMLRAAGLVRVVVRNLPSDWMLKAVSLDGRDVTDTPLAIRGTESITGLEVVVTDRTTEIAGTVADSAGEPVRDYAVVVFAEDRARWTWPSRFIATARPDQDGGFRIARLPPATYLAVALDYLEEGQAEDPEVLDSLRPRATRVTLGEGEAKTLRLKVGGSSGPHDEPGGRPRGPRP